MGELRVIHPPTEPDVSNVNVIHKVLSRRERISIATKDTFLSLRRKLEHPENTLTRFVAGFMGTPTHEL